MLATTQNSFTVTVPRLHSDQLKVERGINSKGKTRFTVLNCGRRWGKTIYLQKWYNKDLLNGFPVAYFCPTYKMLSEVWDSMKDRYRDLIVDTSEQEKHFKLITGGIFDCWSEQNFDSVRGRKYKKVALDEAAMYAKGANAWTKAIRPLLSDYRGEALFPSTPLGQNWYFQLYVRGLDPLQSDWSSYQLPTSGNPYIDKQEILDAQRDLPERIFKQEYLAEFLEDGSGVFRGVTNVCSLEIGWATYDPSHRYVFGVDWAKINDFTVVVIFDATTNRMVELERFQDIDFTVQIARVVGILNKWQPFFGYVEYNGIGEMPFQQLKKQWRYAEPFYTTNDTKDMIISGLSADIEKRNADLGGCYLLNHPQLKSELMSYEVTRTATGKWKYGAVAGAHDDTVMATALAWQAKNDYKRYGGINL